MSTATETERRGNHHLVVSTVLVQREHGYPLRPYGEAKDVLSVERIPFHDMTWDEAIAAARSYLRPEDENHILTRCYLYPFSVPGDDFGFWVYPEPSPVPA